MTKSDQWYHVVMTCMRKEGEVPAGSRAGKASKKGVEHKQYLLALNVFQTYYGDAISAYDTVMSDQEIVMSTMLLERLRSKEQKLTVKNLWKTLDKAQKRLGGAVSMDKQRGQSLINKHNHKGAFWYVFRVLESWGKQSSFITTSFLQHKSIKVLNDDHRYQFLVALMPFMNLPAMHPAPGADLAAFFQNIVQECPDDWPAADELIALPENVNWSVGKLNSLLANCLMAQQVYAYVYVMLSSTHDYITNKDTQQGITKEYLSLPVRSMDDKSYAKSYWNPPGRVSIKYTSCF